MPDRIRIGVVDDHSMFRTGVIQSLAMEKTFAVVGQGSNTDDAVHIAGSAMPDIMLLDVSMPGGGIEAARQISGMEKGPKVVMLTVSEEDDDVVRSLEAGAIGYVLKGVSATELIAILKSIASGESFLSPSLAVRLITGGKAHPGRQPLESLSTQEARILRLVATGMSNREVAEQLGIIEKTVKYHMTNILAKLGARNRVEATVMARREWDM